MNCLYVGDIHAEPSHLQELNDLIDYICKVGRENVCDRLVLLGDQFHHHGLLHLPVVQFWDNSINKFRESFGQVFFLIGNHDKPGNKSDNSHSMMLYKDRYENVTIVDDYVIDSNILYVAYKDNNDELLEICNNFKSRDVLVCHATFDGSCYENGFYAKDSLNPDLIPQKTIISGHLHKPQSFGKVFYPGSPRWRTASDANTNRDIYVINHELNTKKPFETRHVCQAIYSLVDNEENPLNIEKNNKDIYIIDIHGSVEYVNSRKDYFQSLGCRVRTFPKKNYIRDIKESDGISKSLNKFINSFKSKNGTDNEVLLKTIKDRVSWMKET